jgi:predicted dinucleotide-binding enzyme
MAASSNDDTFGPDTSFVKMSKTLARGLAQLGHQIAIANSRGPQTLRDLASDSEPYRQTQTGIIERS